MDGRRERERRTALKPNFIPDGWMPNTKRFRKTQRDVFEFEKGNLKSIENKYPLEADRSEKHLFE